MSTSDAFVSANGRSILSVDSATGDGDSCNRLIDRD